MARDQALLANARIDVERYRTLYAQDSIAKQQVDTQEALVRQYEGTIKFRPGADRQRQAAADLCSHTAPISGRWACACRPGQHRARRRRNGLVVITRSSADDRHLPHPAGQLAGRDAVLRSGEKLRSRPTTRAEEEARLGTLGASTTADRSATGTIKLKAQFRTRTRAFFPISRQRSHAARDRRGRRSSECGVVRGGQGLSSRHQGGKTVELRKVSVGMAEGDSVSVESGLASGELWSRSSDRLRDGAKVGGLPIAPPRGARRGKAPGERRGKRRAKRAHESLAAVHPAAGGDVAPDGRDPARRRDRLPAAATLGFARGGLPDDPGRHLLSARAPDVSTSSITAPLGAPVRQMPGLKQMSSTSSGEPR